VRLRPQSGLGTTRNLARSARAYRLIAMRNPGTAAVLSAVIPGIGQFYNGDFLRGIFWLIVTPGMWIGTGGLFGWVCHVIAAFTAHHRAKVKNRAQT
jgi:TM2 domain-containing membrane protein YozV